MPAYFEHKHLVTFADTNLVGNVYFVNHLAWQGACRERFLAEHAPGVVERLSDDLAIVTVSCSCEYFCELYALDVVSIRMSLAGTGDGRITMNFEYYRTNRGPAQLVARGNQTVACMVRRDGALVPTDVPARLSDALELYPAVPPARSGHDPAAAAPIRDGHTSAGSPDTSRASRI